MKKKKQVLMDMSMILEYLHLLKKVFFIGLTILSNFTSASSSSLNVIPLRCISMKNQECKTRLQDVNVNSNNPIFYPF